MDKQADIYFNAIHHLQFPIYDVHEGPFAPLVARLPSSLDCYKMAFKDIGGAIFEIAGEMPSPRHSGRKESRWFCVRQIEEAPKNGSTKTVLVPLLKLPGHGTKLYRFSEKRLVKLINARLIYRIYG